MKNKFIIAIIVVSTCVGSLIYVGTRSTSKPVVTVNELVAEGVSRKAIRLGAKVTDGEIIVETSPKRVVRFQVRDITKSESSIQIEYQGIMPDTLRAGRDVIVEGDYRNGVFYATQLLTQCPSKYEPPVSPAVTGSH